MSKAIYDISDAVKRNWLSINFQKKTLPALAAQSELAEEISTLKAKLVDFETYYAKKEKYELKNIEITAVAHSLKKDTGATEYSH